MSIPQNIRRTETHSGLPEDRSAANCRQIIRILRGRNGAITEAELAERLAAMPETGSRPIESSTTEELRIRLPHLLLPELADVGLVNWDRDAQTVAATDHPVYDEHRLDDPVPAGDRDSIARVPGDDRRRRILAILQSEDGTVTRETLARELAEGEADGRPAASLREDLPVQLHHTLLPKLDDAGLLGYDPADGTVTSRDAR